MISMFWLYLNIPNELGDVIKKKRKRKKTTKKPRNHKNLPAVKICMWIEDRDSINFICDKEWKHRDWKLESGGLFEILTSKFNQEWRAKLLSFPMYSKQTAFEAWELISKSHMVKNLGIDYVYHIFENWSLGMKKVPRPLSI